MGLSALVTVGTTQFPALTDHVAAASTLRALATLGITSLTIQHGNASIALPAPSAAHPTISAFEFTPTLSAHLSAADLIIAHAGAGTIVEAVALRKPLLVVVNDSLMHNHQTELAEAMARRACCVVTSARLLQAEFVDKVRDVLAMDVANADPPQRVPNALANVLHQQLHG